MAERDPWGSGPEMILLYPLLIVGEALKPADEKVSELYDNIVSKIHKPYDFAKKKNRLTGCVKRLILQQNMVRRKRFELLTPWFVAS